MSVDNRDKHVSAARLALAVKRLRSETAGIDLLAAEPIAIIGLGCRFPGGATNPEKYWEMLEAGVDAIREVPEGRWPEEYRVADIPNFLRFGGYLDDIDGFDAAFFGITPREAQTVDPQQRLLLEVVWEAIWNAAIQPESLSGKPVGVFAAIYSSDYARMQLNRAAEPEAPNAVGAAHSIAAGRISFLLNLKGPCLSIDTACSSSLVAVHLACQSLRARECDTAIAGGVSLKLLPDELLVLDRLGMLSKSARCSTFDAKADGFVPGEGCGVLVLKRLADALADRDPIRAVIRGTAVNHDGRTTVLTAPNGLAHEAVIRQALKNGAVNADDVTYVEAHGTGTSLGDPIELQALQSVYGETASNSADCAVGAVKTNLGHLEAAAGFAGLIKVVLSMEHESIPKNLHFAELNPQSSIEGTRLKIADRQQEWRRGERSRLAGVSSLGFSGTNAHVVVEESPIMPGASTKSIHPRAWQRRSYWLAKATDRVLRSEMTSARAGSITGAWLDSPFLRCKVYELVLDGDALAELTGSAKSSSDGAMVLANRVVRESSADEDFEVLDATLIEPLVASSPMRIQVALDHGRVEVASETPAGWKTHLTARYELRAKESHSVTSMPEQPFADRRNDASIEIEFGQAWSAKSIERLVQREVAAVMEINEHELPLDVPLINLGLDSMMATDLRNRLQAIIGQNLPTTITFEHPTVLELAQEIGTRVWAARAGGASEIDSDQAEEVEI